MVKLWPVYSRQLEHVARVQTGMLDNEHATCHNDGLQLSWHSQLRKHLPLL